MQINNPSAAAAVWGGITGTLSAQTDLNSALTGKRSTVGGNSLLYCTDAIGGQSSLNYSQSAGALTVAQRSASGRITSASPAVASDVVIKSYSDAQFSPNTRTAVGALTGASTAADIVTALQTL